MVDISSRALERARQTEPVAQVFGAHAAHIVAACEVLGEEQVIVAVVDGDFVFRGTEIVSTTELIAEVARLEGEDGWAMIFSAGHDEAAVLRRTEEMAVLAAARGNLIERLRNKQSGSGTE
jgi:hypothetical protein